MVKQHHYFIETEHEKQDYFKFDFLFKNKTYFFNSCSDIFSKNMVDFGSQVLISTIIKKFKSLGSEVLDLGCGYGAIGIILSFYFESNFLLSDINGTCVKLSNENIKLNNSKNTQTVQSNLFENINKKFDCVVSNPPIRTGKELLHTIAKSVYEHLNDNGIFVFVMKKKHGVDSYREYLSEIYSNVEVLEREKGFYIVKATK